MLNLAKSTISGLVNKIQTLCLRLVTQQSYTLPKDLQVSSPWGAGDKLVSEISECGTEILCTVSSDQEPGL